jgi:hypothetical protein
MGGELRLSWFSLGVVFLLCAARSRERNSPLHVTRANTQMQGSAFHWEANTPQHHRRDLTLWNPAKLNESTSYANSICPVRS